MSGSLSMPYRPFAFGTDANTRKRLHELGFTGKRAMDSKRIMSSTKRKPLFDSSKSSFQAAAGERIQSERALEAESDRILAGHTPSIAASERMFIENPNDPWLLGFVQPNNAPAATVGHSTEHMRMALDSWKTNQPIHPKNELYVTGRGSTNQTGVKKFRDRR